MGAVNQLQITFLQQGPLDSMSHSPNDLVLHKYRLQRLLGKSSAVDVWLAVQEDFGARQVVMRWPRRDAPANAEETQRRFDRELQVCRVLEQGGAAYVVRVLTSEPINDGYVLVTDYLPGGDLASLIRNSPRGVPIEQAVHLISQVLGTLSVAHEHPWEIVHRNITPTNILLDAAGNAYLGDFGLAQLAGVSQRSRLQAQPHPGTPGYMAPEQANSTQSLTPAADVYAVGCNLFELLTGKAYRTAANARVRTLRPDVPQALDDLVAKALAPDPFDRFHDATEMVQALQQQSAVVPRTRRSDVQGKAAGRWITAGLVAAVALLAAVLAWSQLQQTRTAASAPVSAPVPTAVAALRVAIANTPPAMPAATRAVSSAGNPGVSAVPPNTDTPTAQPPETSSPASTPAPTHTEVTTSAAVPTLTPLPAATDTATAVPTDTPTPLPTATDTAVPTDTATPLPTATDTPVPTDTATPLPTMTATVDQASTAVALTVQAAFVEATLTALAPVDTATPRATSTATPHRTATAQAEAALLALAVASTQTALAPTFTPIPPATVTPTPNAEATAAAESRRMADAIAETLTAVAPTPDLTATASARMTEVFRSIIATATALAPTATPTDSPTPVPTSAPTRAPIPTPRPTHTPYPTAAPTKAPAQAAPQSSGLFFRASVAVRCENPTKVWFDGMVTIDGQPVNGFRVVFKSTKVPGTEPATNPAYTGPQQEYPGWANGYYWHTVDSSAPAAKDKSLEIWIMDSAGNRISDYAYWQTDGARGGCNYARVDFFAP